MEEKLDSLHSLSIPLPPPSNRDEGLNIRSKICTTHISEKAQSILLLFMLNCALTSNVPFPQPGRKIKKRRIQTRKMKMENRKNKYKIEGQDGERVEETTE